LWPTKLKTLATGLTIALSASRRMVAAVQVDDQSKPLQWVKLSPD
jgi:hypothetical protein